MKLTSLSILAVLIILPFLFIASQQSRIVKKDGQLRSYYDAVIDNAVLDAALMLTQNGEGLSYEQDLGIEEAKKAAAQAFFDTLCLALNAQDDTSKARVRSCVPVLLFLGREGYSLYALNTYQDDQGRTEVKHSWFPVQHYIGESLQDRFLIRYTLENKVYVYDLASGTLEEGDYETFRDRISFFNDAQQFEVLRLAAIRKSIEQTMSAYVKEYNERTFNRSLSVAFHFPGIDESDWKRALKDEGILVFAEGFPVMMGRSYQHYALGGARVIRKKPLTGYSYQEHLYYCREDCTYYSSTVINDPSYDENTLLYFSDAYEAAKNGYFPCSYCSP